MKIKRLVRISLFTAMALLMYILESMLPPLLAFAPGAKMGLSNVITLLAIILLGYADAYIVLLARNILGALIVGNPGSLIYSVPSGLVSLTVMSVLYMFLVPGFSIMAISFIGAVFHNITQVIIASIITSTNLLAILPLMLGASIIAGLFVGITAFLVVKYLPENIYS